MPQIVIFDPNATPQRVLSVSGPSENEGPYAGRADVLIHPNLDAVAGVAVKYWKHVAGAIVSFTAQEIADADAVDAAARVTEARALAGISLDGTFGSQLFMRAFADVLKDEINTLRALHSLAPRTLAQLKTAIINRVNSGSVDS